MELLSGPDLGGGYLFQLQVERAGEHVDVTVHAQDAGLEAAAPARGPLTDLGFERATTPCPLGGRDCFHRTYSVSPDTLGRVRMTYNRTRFVVGPSLEQRFGEGALPIADALRTVADRLASLGPSGIPWFVGGSASAFLQGVEVRPRDIDLGTDRPGVDRIADALAEFLIEPPASTTWPPARPMYAARAFVGSLVTGVRTEWAALEPGPGLGAPSSEWGRPATEVAVTIANWEGRQVPVARLEYFAVKAAQRRDSLALRAVAGRLAELGVDQGLLDSLTVHLPEPDRRRLTAALEAAGPGRVQA